MLRAHHPAPISRVSTPHSASRSPSCTARSPRPGPAGASASSSTRSRSRCPRSVSTASPASLRSPALSDHPVHDGAEPQPVDHRRRRTPCRLGRPGRRDQDRGRRRRRRSGESVLRPVELYVSRRLPAREHAVHDAEGDRRAHLPGPRIGRAGEPPGRPRGVVPRHARRGHRGRERGDDGAAGSRSSARHRTLRASRRARTSATTGSSPCRRRSATSPTRRRSWPRSSRRSRTA